MADSDVQLSQYIIPNEAAVCLLDCKKAFEALTSQEKMYAHHLSRADWYGSLICLLQVCLLLVSSILMITSWMTSNQNHICLCVFN